MQVFVYAFLLLLYFLEHIQNLGAIYLPSQDNAPQISLRDAISKQVRRPAPVPANNPQEG
jgi:hypothetical protein